tara:strand:- start:162 stop:689 length:528 start_codon:yes stop_codon:yes gene_type:complete
MAKTTFWSEAQSDPKRRYRFVLYVGGIPLWTVKTTNKPTANISTTEHQFLNHTFKFPGRVTWDPISVTLVDPLNPDMCKSLINKLYASGYANPLTPNVRETLSKEKSTQAIGTVRIAQIDDTGVPVEEWQLINPFFTKMQFGDLDYTSDDLTEINVEITYDYAVLSALGPGEPTD